MNNRSLSFLKYSSAALLLCVSTNFAAAQDVALGITADEEASIEAGCKTDAQCEIAIQTLITRLRAKYPSAPLGRIVGSIVSKVATGYNQGRVSPAVARSFFTAARNQATANSLPGVTRALTVAQNAVERGDAIDLGAVAEGAASPS
jgi:hypothetical protein